jgi:hypothetical protein
MTRIPEPGRRAGSSRTRTLQRGCLPWMLERASLSPGKKGVALMTNAGAYSGGLAAAGRWPVRARLADRPGRRAGAIGPRAPGDHRPLRVRGLRICAHAYLAVAVFAGFLANTFFGALWLDGAVALTIA